ncbi:MAG: M20/M25/M40 family metallo-hydrolase [Chlamydiia bacterium]|nr:M20/M25/M40 family metallo-hydrolase [Chlamydiia bacterium]
MKKSMCSIDEVISLLMEWVNTNSGSLNQKGLEKMSQKLDAAFGPFDRLPIPNYEFLNSDGKKMLLPSSPVLRKVVNPTAHKQVLLVGHQDTVFAQDHPFQTGRMVSEGIFRGPGSADMKGGLLVMLLVVEALKHEEVGLEILINPDEEIGSRSSRMLLEEAAKRHQLAVVFEPAMPCGALVSDRGGSWTLSLFARGREAHAGRDPEAGRSSIHALADLIMQMEKRVKLLNVGKITGGRGANIVASEAFCQINIRGSLNPLAVLEEVIREMETKRDVTITVHIDSERPPKPLTMKMKEMMPLIPTAWQSTNGVCDGNLLAANGLTVIDTLGVVGGALHTEREWMQIDSIFERAQWTIDLIRKVIA